MKIWDNYEVSNCKVGNKVHVIIIINYSLNRDI